MDKYLKTVFLQLNEANLKEDIFLDLNLKKNHD